MLDTIKSVLTPIHREGHVFILIFAGVSLLLGMFSGALGWLGAIATCWCVYFFRDPDRVTPDREGLIVSPADGVICKIEPASPPPELEMDETPRTRVSIFLNVFDVHVNRTPIAGTISKLHYHPGTFINASLDKASEDNERQSALVTTEEGKDVAFVQIAGLVARRIVCNLHEGQQVNTGERFGIIRFGSRVDVYLPLDVQPLVAEGQRAVGGETILADLQSEEDARAGTTH